MTAMGREGTAAGRGEGGLTVTGLTVRLGGHIVAQNVSLEAGAGAVTGLIGPNGAGKTTVLRAAAGLLPAEGRVSLNATDLATLRAPDRARRVAYLPQEREVNWPLTVRNIVALGRLPHCRFGRALSPADAEAVQRAMRAADVGALADRPGNSLSGGEKARVLLARALAVEAPLLLADEPVAHLDPAHALRTMDALANAAALGTTVLVVLHDLTLAARFCSRLVLMAGGQIQAAGPPRQVLTRAHLAGSYGVEAQLLEGPGDAPVVVPGAVLT